MKAFEYAAPTTLDDAIKLLGTPERSRPCRAGPIS